jgi:hypothetical protein
MENSDETFKRLENDIILYAHANALGRLLKEGTGIVIDVREEWMKVAIKSDKIIVYRLNNQLIIDNNNSQQVNDVVEGTIVLVANMNFN